MVFVQHANKTILRYIVRSDCVTALVISCLAAIASLHTTILYIRESQFSRPALQSVIIFCARAIVIIFYYYLFSSLLYCCIVISLISYLLIGNFNKGCLCPNPCVFSCCGLETSETMEFLLESDYCC